MKFLTRSLARRIFMPLSLISLALTIAGLFLNLVARIATTVSIRAVFNDPALFYGLLGSAVSICIVSLALYLKRRSFLFLGLASFAFSYGVALNQLWIAGTKSWAGVETMYVCFSPNNCGLTYWSDYVPSSLPTWLNINYVIFYLFALEIAAFYLWSRRLWLTGLTSSIILFVYEAVLLLETMPAASQLAMFNLHVTMYARWITNGQVLEASCVGIGSFIALGALQNHFTKQLKTKEKLNTGATIGIA